VVDEGTTRPQNTKPQTTVINDAARNTMPTCCDVVGCINKIIIIVNKGTKMFNSDTENNTFLSPGRHKHIMCTMQAGHAKTHPLQYPYHKGLFEKVIEIKLENKNITNATISEKTALRISTLLTEPLTICQSFQKRRCLPVLLVRYQHQTL